MFRRFAFVLGLLLLIGASVAPVAAQGRVDPAFSDTLIHNFGYPEIAIDVTPDGVSAPSMLEAGYYVVTLSASDDYVAYLDFMQPPAGLSEEEATALALAAARNDLVQEGWVYAGGTNTPNPGESATFIINLAPGEYQIAASYYTIDGSIEEEMRLVPLTVTEAATPAATPVAEPAATVTLEMGDDLTYTISPDPVPTGPQVWKITNTGTHHAHHAVVFRVPDGLTAQAIIGEFSSLMAGTPPAAESPLAEFTWVAYAALQSGGQTTWAEFDLPPASYAVICYIVDPTTGRPHFLDGMVTLFTVA